MIQSTYQLFNAGVWLVRCWARFCILRSTRRSSSIARASADPLRRQSPPKFAPDDRASTAKHTSPWRRGRSEPSSPCRPRRGAPPPEPGPAAPRRNDRRIWSGSCAAPAQPQAPGRAPRQGLLRSGALIPRSTDTASRLARSLARSAADGREERRFCAWPCRASSWPYAKPGRRRLPGAARTRPRFPNPEQAARRRNARANSLLV